MTPAGPGAPDPFDPFRRLVTGMAEATRAMVAGAAAGEPLPAQAEHLADVYRASVEPLRAVLEEQRELSDRLAAGLEQLRRLTEDFGLWLEQHRRMVDQTQRLVEPLLDSTERMASGVESWARRGPDR